MFGGIGDGRRRHVRRRLRLLMRASARCAVRAGWLSSARARARGVADVDPLPADTDVDYQLAARRRCRRTSASWCATAGPRRDGRYNVCYVNGFQTQPDEQRFWKKRTAAGAQARRPAGRRRGVGRVAARHPHEGEARALARIVGRWTDGAPTTASTAVEYDNLDSFTRSHRLLERRHAIAFARLLVRRAHAPTWRSGRRTSPASTAPDRLRLRGRRGVRALPRVPARTSRRTAAGCW